jgi:NAD(P)-dependent dehydrogenase (short-subunit alcohol dehydrogenase family)
MDLTGKVVLLTGVKRVGAVVAESLARGGADIALVHNRSSAESGATVEVVRALGRRAVAIQADLGNPADCQRVVDDTVRELGRLDVLIAMASIYASVPLTAISVEQWNRQLEVDLRSAFLCAQAAIGPMKTQGGGRVIFFSDWVAASGRPRYPGFVHYYVAKAGVKALAEAMALELAADGILVNAIAPGPILAPPDITAEERQAVAEATPVGRWGGAAEIVKTVKFLIDTDFVTGETIRVDGGRHLK